MRISLKKVAEATFLKHSNRQGRIAALPIVCALLQVRQILLRVRRRRLSILGKIGLRKTEA